MADDGDAECSFGERIRELRKEAGMTQRDVAANLGIDFTYLSKLENDRGETPGEKTVRRIAELFDAEPEELLALAGKLPDGLRKRAQKDVRFARFLRRLPDADDADLKQIYKRWKIDDPPAK
jgi:HTH-type transcriptional regulator, competence development regulator